MSSFSQKEESTKINADGESPSVPPDPVGRLEKKRKPRALARLRGNSLDTLFSLDDHGRASGET
jgi:hypothetical protein